MASRAKRAGMVRRPRFGKVLLTRVQSRSDRLTHFSFNPGQKELHRTWHSRLPKRPLALAADRTRVVRVVCESRKKVRNPTKAFSESPVKMRYRTRALGPQGNRNTRRRDDGRREARGAATLRATGR